MFYLAKLTFEMRAHTRKVHTRALGSQLTYIFWNRDFRSKKSQCKRALETIAVTMLCYCTLLQLLLTNHAPLVKRRWNAAVSPTESSANAISVIILSLSLAGC